ncbi:PilZ domain-containing protein [Actinoplanes sp. NEAU-A12]|uniref:PilZ domain-containing protein n=1 Tax=Actinoplanes sandaracinus TaxID=3045177 RepID=A0ABT6WYM1_9ACTN|nr:PilZ domain-containing protein [Actinoplanes sandaracinus]MDI6104829.1 PilZ domain-containing protein [Actinoplanes sandaracinus]
MADLPPIGTPVYLVPGEDVSYRSRVEFVDGDRFAVAAPLETSDRDALQPGQRCEVFWARARARILVLCELVEVIDSAPSRWVLAATGQTREGNRRQYVRGGGGTAVGLHPGSTSGPVQGRLIDISEGGLRCWTAKAADIAAGDRMRASVSLGAGEVEVTGVVHAVREAVDEAGYHLILRFISSEPVAQRIRQHIFAWEIAERRHAQGA